VCQVAQLLFYNSEASQLALLTAYSNLFQFLPIYLNFIEFLSEKSICGNA